MAKAGREIHCLGGMMIESRLRGCTALLCGANLALTALLPATTILSLAPSPASAATPEAKSKPAEKKPVSPEERKRLQKRVDEVKSLLEEASQGKRDDAEKYVLLRHLLTNYAFLQMEKTDPAVRSAKHEWDELLRKHPEFKVNPPSEIGEQRDARQRRQEYHEKIRAKAANFTPNDSRILGGLRGSAKSVVALYQYRIEFYRPGFDVELSTGDQGDELLLKKNGKELPISELKPVKTLSFSQTITLTPGWPRTFDHPFWVCTDPLHGYAANSNEEREILQFLGFEHWMPWKNPKGEIDDFCGAIAQDGTILYALPEKQRAPDHLFRVIEVADDGKRAIILLGEKTIYSQDDAVMVGNPREVLVWEYPDRLGRFPIGDAPPDVVAALRRWGWAK